MNVRMYVCVTYLHVPYPSPSCLSSHASLSWLCVWRCPLTPCLPVLWACHPVDSPLPQSVTITVIIYTHTSVCVCLCLYVHHHHYIIHICAYCTAIHLCNLHCISLLLCYYCSYNSHQHYTTSSYNTFIILIEFNYRLCTLDFFLCFLGFFVFSDFTAFCFALGVVSWSSGL